ncbi:DUF4298 domain-containing protein [Ignavigranum ruoffiae]|uniref:DUF4298 domain-containing protein n=1 Tax=Ignavigranum ruoffiae TaxID=89093 RepID=UPI0020575D7D|nr:DUF4298 domain-containing protein [Ignavigranum ruoffiae]UPQ85085.1 DUF4298 domain-containing protein [Ignavigranum ruoffiae]
MSSHQPEAGKEEAQLKQRIEWVEYMEAVKDRRWQLVKTLDQALSQLVESEEDYQRLLDYYGSQEFRQDMDDSNQGIIPAEVKQGVLSEDEVFNLVGANYDLSVRLIEVAALLLKHP